MEPSLFKTLFVLPLLLNCAIAQNLGKWSEIIRFPLIPVGAMIVPEFPQSNRLLLFSATSNTSFGGGNGRTQFGDWNFNTRQYRHTEVSHTNHDMFCPAISYFPDNRILITGGVNAQESTVYDPSSNTFADASNMQRTRGYHVSVTLSNGNVFTIGGSWNGGIGNGIGNKDGEVYDPALDDWTYLPAADESVALTRDQEADKRDNHMWLYAWRNGFVFQAGPSRRMHWYGTSGSGSVQYAGNRENVNDAINAVHVMYDATAGKIFAAGGSNHYTGQAALNLAFIITLGQPNTNPVVERISNMQFARAVANAVVLPDGKVFITGGQSQVHTFKDYNSVTIPELWDPATKAFTRMATESVPRNYHSVSILLADGRVFSGGGGLCWYTDSSCDTTGSNHPDAQIFSPPYLFNSDGTNRSRPVISGTSTQTVRPGGTLGVTVAGGGGLAGFRYALVRLGSVTHSINSDQRRVPLTAASTNGQTATLNLPTDSGILIPGPYYLFVMDAAGTPSVARTISVVL